MMKEFFPELGLTKSQDMNMKKQPKEFFPKLGLTLFSMGYF